MNFLTGMQLPTVEPVKRWVGGRFGYAYHRFPIKGGITPLQAHSRMVSEAVRSAAFGRNSFFAKLIGDLGSNAPITHTTEQHS